MLTGASSSIPYATQADLAESAYRGGKLGAEFIDRCRRSNADPDALSAFVAELTNAGNVPGLRACLRRIQKELERG